MTDNIISKICTKCKIEKPLLEFGVSKYSKDGLAHNCKKCKSEYSNQYKKSNPPTQAQKDHKREYDKIYNEENKEWIKVRTKIYYANNKDTVKISALKWVAKNIEKVREIKRQYKSKRRLWEKENCDPTNTIMEWVKSAEKVCYWCGCDCEDNYHQDHYIPLSKGGSHTVDNLVISCPTCNLRKSAKLPEDFRAELDRELEDLKQ